jgi:sigma-B regulation protein RsbU (phosphoserine phosphatase)
MAVGTRPGQEFPTEEIVVDAGSTLYIFSDGVFEIVTRSGTEWSLAGFRDLVLQDRVPGTNESDRLQRAVKALSQTMELADDFSLLIAEFT